jgi:hypothetical protein
VAVRSRACGTVGAQHAFDLMFALRYSYVIEAVVEFCAARRR